MVGMRFVYGDRGKNVVEAIVSMRVLLARRSFVPILISGMMKDEVKPILFFGEEGRMAISEEDKKQGQTLDAPRPNHEIRQQADETDDRSHSALFLTGHLREVSSIVGDGLYHSFCQLPITEGVGGVEPGGAPCWVESEDDADGHREEES